MNETVSLPVFSYAVQRGSFGTFRYVPHFVVLAAA